MQLNFDWYYQVAQYIAEKLKSEHSDTPSTSPLDYRAIGSPNTSYIDGAPSDEC